MIVFGRFNIPVVLSALESIQAEHCSSWLLKMAHSGLQMLVTLLVTNQNSHLGLCSAFSEVAFPH